MVAMGRERRRAIQWNCPLLRCEKLLLGAHSNPSADVANAMIRFELNAQVAPLADTDAFLNGE